MCLITTQKRAVRATEDVPCWKLVRRSSKGFRSVHFGAIYTYDKRVYYPYNLRTKKRVMRLIRTYSGFSKIVHIYKGLHTYTSQDCAMRVCKLGERRAVLEFVIPKGTLYYTSECGRYYVSLKLRLVSEPRRIKKKK